MKKFLIKTLTMILCVSFSLFLVSCYSSSQTSQSESDSIKESQTVSEEDQSESDSIEESQSESQPVEIDEGLDNYYYEKTDTECVITGVKDSSVTDVHIPSCVTKIESDVFINCAQIERVHINSIENWLKIEFEMDFLNSIVYSNPLCLLLNDNYSSPTLCIDEEPITEIVIPNTITEVKDFAFFCYDKLESVVIGDGVEHIGDYAFYGNFLLGNVEFGKNVKTIGVGAFADSAEFTNIVFSDSVEIIGEDAFSRCSSITSIEFGSGLKHIGATAFYNLNDLISIVIPENVIEIEEEAFLDCTRLVEVVNKSSHITVEKGSTENGYLGYYAINIFNSQDEFVSNLSKNNEYVMISDGEEYIVVDYEGAEVNLKLPSGTTKINGYAFTRLVDIESIEIPDSVITIGEGSFYACFGLYSIVIGSGVESIANSAFDFCLELNNVFYKGSAQDWANVVIGEDNQTLLDAKIYYYIESDEDLPTDGGNYWHFDGEGNPVIW